MEKISYDDLPEINGVLKEFNENKYSCVYRLSNGDVFKYIDPNSIKAYLNYGIDKDSLAYTGILIEKKVADADKIGNIKGIVLPKKMVYIDGIFVGYTIPYIDGVSVQNYKFKKNDINYYTNFYKKLEQTVKNANSKGIVFPDLLTSSNIMIKDNEIYLIDYDGMQIGKNGSFVHSRGLGDLDDISNRKCLKLLKNRNDYLIDASRRGLGLYSSDLDKKSLLIYYYKLLFNCDIYQISNYKKEEDKKDLLQEIFRNLNIANSDLREITNLTFLSSDKNVYLGDLVDQIAKENTLKPKEISKTKDKKILVRKLSPKF